MAGLIDALKSDEGQLGLALLAAAGPSMQPISTGQRLAGAFGQFQAQGAAKQEADLKRLYVQSQIDENRSQALQREAQIGAAQRQQEWMQGLFGSAPNTVQGQGAQAGQSFPAPAPMGPMPDGGMVPPQQRQPSRLEQLSAQYNVPVEALQADLATNGGKGIAQLIAERSKPNWQNINGNLVNTNEPGFKGGLQAGYVTSANGQTNMIQPDGQGSIVVGAPRGALETYRAYKGIDADLEPYKVFNPQEQREEFTTRGAVARSGAASSGNGYAGGSPAAAASGQLEILQGELQRAQQQYSAAGRSGNVQEQARAQRDIESLQREIGRIQMTPRSTSGRMAAGPSASESARNAANQAREVNTAAADVVRDTDKQKNIKTAKQFLSIADQVEKVFEKGPTNSGIGAMIDSGAAMFGRSTQGAVAAQQLKALGGWLVANVPRMEGPQSNFDVANYQVMAADVANDRLPLDRRMAALQSIKQMMNEQVSLNSGDGTPKPAVDFQAAARAELERRKGNR